MYLTAFSAYDVKLYRFCPCQYLKVSAQAIKSTWISLSAIHDHKLGKTLQLGRQNYQDNLDDKICIYV